MQIKLGSTRKVFIFKNFVIKIPNIQEYRLFLHGILANLQEKTFSCMNRIDLGKVKFCSHFGFILAMEKANVLNYEDIDWNKFEDFLKLKYKDDEMKEFMLSDLKPTNWGYINNQLVRIDYGN